MGRVAAERAFGLATKHIHPDIPQPTDGKLRNDLRELLADHRVLLDSGMNIEVVNNPSSLEAPMAAVKVTKSKPVPCGTLPFCDRWGDVYTGNCSFVSRRVSINDVLAHDSRHSLPCATRVAAKATDVGPGCNMRAEMNSLWVEPISYERVCQGILNMGEAPADQAVDPIAMQMDGDRIWPPRAVLDEEDSVAVAALVRTLCDELQTVDARVLKTNGIGSYIEAMKRIIDAGAMTRPQKQLLELGIGIFARNPLAFHSARKRALHTAMACHVRDRSELGGELERLGQMIMGLSVVCN